MNNWTDPRYTRDTPDCSCNHQARRDQRDSSQWWAWIASSGAALLLLRALSSDDTQASTGTFQTVTMHHDGDQEAPFPWGEVAAGGLLGLATVKLAPKVIELLDSLFAASPPAQQTVAHTVKVTPEVTAKAAGTKVGFDSPAETLKTAIMTPPASWTPPPDSQWLQLAPHPSVIPVLGKRGSGKSALGYRLLELYRDVASPYVIGVPSNVRKLLPEWVGVVDRLEDVPQHAVVLMDEAYLHFHARTSMSGAGRTIGAAVNLSRQRGQTLIFVVQEARQLDVNVISQADVIAVKELSEISREFERRELRPLTDKARAEFKAISGDRRRWTWIYSEKTDFSGMVENQLASFWRPALSRAFASAGLAAPNPGPATTLAIASRKGARTPRAESAVKAKALRNAGHSYGHIARVLGIPKSTAWDLVNGQ